MTIAGWILVLWLWGEPAVIPTPYSSVETCSEAAQQVDERLERGKHFICVPLEAPNVRGFLDGLKQSLEQFKEQ
jgi:hypothetical protein